jgi:hypothetical protein
LNDIIGVNNYGQSILLAFGILNNEKKESICWFMTLLKEAWKDKSLKNSSYAKFCFKISQLKDDDSTLYQKLINLPFVTDAIKFNKIVDDLDKSEFATDSDDRLFRR